ncbi:hypothetical protein [Bradyrhizobium sp. USDA 4452]
MITDRLSDPQFYALMAIFLGLGIAGLVTVIAWPFHPERDTGAGFRWVKR